VGQFAQGVQAAVGLQPEVFVLPVPGGFDFPGPVQALFRGFGAVLGLPEFVLGGLVRVAFGGPGVLQAAADGAGASFFQGGGQSGGLGFVAPVQEALEALPGGLFAALGLFQGFGAPGVGRLGIPGLAPVAFQLVPLAPLLLAR